MTTSEDFHTILAGDYQYFLRYRTPHWNHHECDFWYGYNKSPNFQKRAHHDNSKNINLKGCDYEAWGSHGAWISHTHFHPPDYSFFPLQTNPYKECHDLWQLCHDEECHDLWDWRLNKAFGSARSHYSLRKNYGFVFFDKTFLTYVCPDPHFNLLWCRLCLLAMFVGWVREEQSTDLQNEVTQPETI